MQGGDLLEARRDQARRHPLRLAILALSVQGKSLDPKDLHRELPTHPRIATIEYHLSVLRQVDLLSFRPSA
jgi:hypothetical protein